MKWTLSIDPGLRGCGIALFEGPTLVKAWYVMNSVKSQRGPHAWLWMAKGAMHGWLRRAPRRARILHSVVLEVPQVYWRSSQGGNAADLIEIAGVVGAISSMVPTLDHIHYLPRQWKGTMKKEAHNARVLKKLSELERGLIETNGAKQHNVIDAVGLGLYFLGRLQ